MGSIEPACVKALVEVFKVISWLDDKRWKHIRRLNKGGRSCRTCTKSADHQSYAIFAQKSLFRGLISNNINM